MVEEDRIYEILTQENADSTVQGLIDEANANGGKDNIAVIVAEV